MDKVQISQKEIDDVYEIIEDKPKEGDNSKKEDTPSMPEDTTPDFLTKEEQAFDKAMHTESTEDVQP